MNPAPGPVMNSLVSDTKVVTNDSIPNPITAVPIPIPLDEKKTKSITVLEGVVIKPVKGKCFNMNWCDKHLKYLNATDIVWNHFNKVLGPIHKKCFPGLLGSQIVRNDHGELLNALFS